MKRTLLSDLILWKNNPDRKPLLIHGARQVGKTWLMKEFGRTAYRDTVYINFEDKRHMTGIFETDFNITRILTALSIESGAPIRPAETLLIFDEIQEVPRALTALKYFHENAPEIHILAAGSLLGMSMHRNNSFPVGKVEFLNLYPLDFYEFLTALGYDEYVNMLQKRDWPLVQHFSTQLIDLLKQYYFTGGMPEVVATMIKTRNFSEVRKIQKNILNSYEQDFSKHPPLDLIPRIRMLWNSIPAQLAKENKKFIFGQLKSGARAKDYEMALYWLLDCGLIHKINRIHKGALPLKAYEETNAFKVFLGDVGLLAAMADLDSRTILEGNRIFEEFKGSLTEQFVIQQLKCHFNTQVYYWSEENSRAELDFIIHLHNQLIPIEVKAAENLQAKSMKVFHQKYAPECSVRISMSPYRHQGWMVNLPLYAVAEIGSIFVSGSETRKHPD